MMQRSNTMRKVKNLNRRDFLRISTGLALGAVAAACAPAKPTPAPTEVPEVPEAPAAPELPFEVAPEAIDPLNVEKGTAEGIFFEGGYGIDYIKYAADILDKLHPETEISVTGIQRVDEQLRPRFIAGNPPDVIDNSGAGNLDTTALAAEGQLLDLEPLMNAAALDTPGKLFKETLFPGSQEVGVFDGKQLFLNIAYTVFGVWHSKSLFEKKGWEYPKMWDDMLDFCAMIKKETDMSPWTYQGKYPGYMVFGVLVPLIYKIGGNQAIINLDNLEPDAWRAPEVKEAVNLMYQLAEQDYIMPGTAGLTHTESQAEWLQGKAVFLPCGTWLENEMKGLTPDGFDMVVKPVPGIEAGKGSPESIYASSGETYFVPAKAKNPRTGMEFLRCLMSKAGAKYFVTEVASMMPIIGGAEGVELSPAMDSAIKDVEAAGDEIFVYKYPGWYRKLDTEVSNRTGELLTKRMTVDEFIDAIQKVADEVKADPDIPKYRR